MLAINIFLCGFLGLWTTLYATSALMLFGIFFYFSSKKAAWEHALAFTGFILGSFSIILAFITRIVI